MNKITIYVIPNDDPKRANIKKLKNSFGFEGVEFVSLDNRDLAAVNPKTPYYGFLFDNEWLSDGLRFALPIWIANFHKFDYLVVFKRVFVLNNNIPEPHVFTVPRFFKSEVRLINDSLVPENHEGLKFERVMDGWILETNR